jgi:hypothetical protein
VVQEESVVFYGRGRVFVLGLKTNDDDEMQKEFLLACKCEFFHSQWGRSIDSPHHVHRRMDGSHTGRPAIEPLQTAKIRYSGIGTR